MQSQPQPQRPSSDGSLNPRTQETGANGSLWVQGHPGLFESESVYKRNSLPLIPALELYVRQEQGVRPGIQSQAISLQPS